MTLRALSSSAFPFVILATLFAFCCWAVFRNRVRVWSARNWPVSRGHIEFGTVLQNETRYGTYYIARLEYSYTVGGEYYSGNYENGFFSEVAAQHLVDDLSGKDVFVRHNPNSPDVSAIRKEDQRPVWILEN